MGRTINPVSEGYKIDLTKRLHYNDLVPLLKEAGRNLGWRPSQDCRDRITKINLRYGSPFLDEEFSRLRTIEFRGRIIPSLRSVVMYTWLDGQEEQDFVYALFSSDWYRDRYLDKLLRTLNS